MIIVLGHFGYRTAYPSLRIFAGGVSAVVLLGLLLGELGGTIAAPRWLQFLGDASYTIYLTHFALLSALAKLFVGVGLMKFFPAEVAFILLAGMSLAIACLLYETIERPLVASLQRSKLARVPVGNQRDRNWPTLRSRLTAAVRSSGEKVAPWEWRIALMTLEMTISGTVAAEFSYQVVEKGSRKVRDHFLQKPLAYAWLRGR